MIFVTRMELPSERYRDEDETPAVPSTHETPATDTNSSLSKNKLRKLRRHEQVIDKRKQHRIKEREARKLKGLKKRRGNDEKLAETEKLKQAQEIGCKVVIDCQYQNQMTFKEQTRFAQQLRRVYSSNRASESPLHLCLASFSRESELYNICCKQNDGFANYVLDINEKAVLELFPQGEVVYLTPDASNVISLDNGFEPHKVYVIGGLVDETTTKNLTYKFAESRKVSCARLPIGEFFEPGESGTFKKVLTVNQVVDIILEWHQTKDWISAILKGLPERTGFRPKSGSQRQIK